MNEARTITTLVFIAFTGSLGLGLLPAQWVAITIMAVLLGYGLAMRKEHTL